jgi:hypothetical protein
LTRQTSLSPRVVLCRSYTPVYCSTVALWFLAEHMRARTHAHTQTQIRKKNILCTVYLLTVCKQYKVSQFTCTNVFSSSLRVSAEVGKLCIVYEINNAIVEIRGSQSGMDEDSSIMTRNAVFLCKYSPTFRSILLLCL